MKKNPEAIRQAAHDPRFRGAIEAPNYQSSGRNPLCGDEIKIFLRITGDVIEELGADVCGCLVTSAAWTITARSLHRQNLGEARAILTNLVNYLDRKTDFILDATTDLAAFQRPSPRRECARLPAKVLSEVLAFEQNDTGVPADI